MAALVREQSIPDSDWFLVQIYWIHATCHLQIEEGMHKLRQGPNPGHQGHDQGDQAHAPGPIGLPNFDSPLPKASQGTPERQ